MADMNNVDYKLFTTIARMSQKQLLKSMNNFLKKYYPTEKITATSHYILCEGTEPIMLVAHMDTVFKTPPKNIYYDRRQRVMWSPQGLGADDRAGIFAIMKIIQDGYRPHVCFTTDEEKGGIGASILTSKIPKAPFDLKYIIQLDRQGICDSVFYYCDNLDFENYVQQYDFITDWGTFSDISVICPAWKIAGVNLSIGYFDEHSKTETLHTDALYLTIKKVEKMIEDIDNAPIFEYIAMPYDYYLNKIYGYGCFPGADDEYDDDPYSASRYIRGPYQCSRCNEYFTMEELIPVKSKDNKRVLKNYCVHCIDSNINWCESCGEAFESDDPKEKYCPDCTKPNTNKNLIAL